MLSFAQVDPFGIYKTAVQTELSHFFLCMLQQLLWQALIWRQTCESIFILCFLHFPIWSPGQVCYLIVKISDLYLLPYFG